MPITSKEAWEKLISGIGSIGIDVPTCPITSTEPKWFFVHTKGNCIVVESSKNKMTYSKITKPRSISYDNFSKVFPYYYKRRNGDQVSKFVKSITNNQVYIYGLIQMFVDLD